MLTCFQYEEFAVEEGSRRSLLALVKSLFHSFSQKVPHGVKEDNSNNNDLFIDSWRYIVLYGSNKNAAIPSQLLKVDTE